MPFAAVTGWGMYVPNKVLTNADLEKIVDTSDQWIVSRTGIRERRIAGPGEGSTSMASAAARAALERAGLAAVDVDLLIVATTTPDQLMPSAACSIQTAIGALGAAPIDLNAACSGFVYALTVATQCVRTGVFGNALVIGVDTLSRFIDYSDRGTCILFGDGAGAVVIEASDTPGGVLASDLGALPGTGALLEIPAGGAARPASAETVAAGLHYMTMQGPEVFKLAVRAMGDSSAKVIAEAGLEVEDIALLIPHQANLRIIDATAKRLNLAPERVFVNIERYGNTSAATIPIAICEAWDAGRLKSGDLAVLTAFGGGLTWGSAVVKF